jgi:methyl-accepting chemotaxis protein
MNLLRNVPISKRLWLIPVVAVVMLFILGMLMIQQVRSDLYRGKQEATRNVVEAAAVCSSTTTSSKPAEP